MSEGSRGGTRRSVEALLCITPSAVPTNEASTALSALLARTPATVTLLASDDLTTNAELPERVISFNGDVYEAARRTPDTDLVLVESGSLVQEGWFDRLREAAYADPLTATASAMTETILVGDGGTRRLLTDADAMAVERASLRLRPRIEQADSRCVYVRRSAIELLGADGLGPPLTIFAERATKRGLRHVLADDVFVYSALPGASTSLARPRTLEGPTRVAAGVVRRALDGLTVTIDARCLADTLTGTQLQVLEVVHALHRNGGARLRVVTSAHIGRRFRESLQALDGVDIASVDDIPYPAPRSLIVHRPYQVFDPADLPLLMQLGDRLVLTLQDLIAYGSPDYARSTSEWEDLRHLTRTTVSLADRVVFFSKYVARDAEAEGLLASDTGTVVHLGVDHRALSTEQPRRPTAWPDKITGPFLLCLGTNFTHKNRLFALELLEALEETHGWHGALVFAGPHAPRGSSADDEAAWLARHPSTAHHVCDLGEVEDGEKRWLLEHAAAVVYPSLQEGFGLVPFEAAAVGTPCAFAAQTSLAELLPEQAAVLVPWNLAASASLVFELLADPVAAKANVDAIAAVGSHLSWETTASNLIRVYEDAVRAPGPPFAGLVRGDPVAFVQLVRGDSTAAVPDEVFRAYRALMARRGLRTLAFTIIRTMYWVARQLLRHRRAGWP